MQDMLNQYVKMVENIHVIHFQETVINDQYNYCNKKYTIQNNIAFLQMPLNTMKKKIRFVLSPKSQNTFRWCSDN